MIDQKLYLYIFCMYCSQKKTKRRQKKGKENTIELLENHGICSEQRDGLLWILNMQISKLLLKLERSDSLVTNRMFFV